MGTPATDDWMPDPDTWEEPQVAKVKLALQPDSKISPERRAILTKAYDYYSRTHASPDDEPEPETPAPAPDPTKYTAPPVKPAGAGPSVGESALRGGAQGASLGFADEAAGYGAWLQSLVGDGLARTPRAVSRGVDAPLDTRTEYQVGRDAYRQEDAAAQEENPWAFKGGELGGTAITSMIPVAKGAQALGWLARAGRAAKTGAALGAATGLGMSEDPTLEGQAIDAATGGIVGGVTAPVIGETVHQAIRFGKPLVTGIAKWAGGKLASNEAERIAAAHGEDASRLALDAADPASQTGKAQRALVHAGESPEALEAHARAVTDDLTGIAKHGDAIEAYETIGEKARIAKKYFERDGVDPEQIAKHADEIATRVRQSVEEIRPHVSNGTPEAQLLGRIEKQIEEYSLLPLDERTGTPMDIAGDR